MAIKTLPDNVVLPLTDKLPVKDVLPLILNAAALLPVKNKEPDNKALGLKTIYNEFKYWHQQEELGSSRPSKRQLKDYMIKRYGKMKRGGWINIELIKGGQQENNKMNIEDFDDETTDELDPLDNPVI